ncbi:MAG TPA: glycosyltransferase family 2 protein [Methylophilaceae bacterium]|nr:glycosyltransferase family 2 protein [Methylophilaceae bacterium]
MVRLSIVVPLYNEEDNVFLLYQAIKSALEGKVRHYEIVLIDDGSSDATFRRAASLVETDSRVRVVLFRRNYGQTAAMAAGIKTARGDVIVTMDGDLQNDPSDIPKLLALIEDGYDIAVGWRRKRKDDFARVFISQIANRIMARVMGVAVRDSGCSLKAYRASLIQDMPMYGEMHRFIPALSKLAGARLAQIEVKHHPRRFGVSKYGFSRIYKVMLDIISIRALLSYARHSLSWLATMSFLVFVTGTAFITASLFDGPDKSVVDTCIGVLLVSLSLFLMAWTFLGRLFSAVEPGATDYAALNTILASRIASLRENAS